MRGLVIALLLLGALATGSAAQACDRPVSVCATSSIGSFPLITGDRPATLLVEPGADTAVTLAADNFATDLERVSGHAPARIATTAGATGDLVIVGVLGQSTVIDDLIARGRIETGDIAGQWEAFRQIVVEAPYPGVERALVIVGADRRGAVFGLYDLSEKIGVSPWHWFADVPVHRRSDVFVTAGARRDQPGVRYRGIFINDEDPGFATWARTRFGGINVEMYQHVFELILRLRGNYLWPAMWAPKAFNADDPRNMVLADAMGVVMGTSHHEPLTRAQDEWHRDTESGVTGGRWDYAANGENVRTFWRGGIERMMSRGDGRPFDTLVTIGMRGDGDEAMAEGTAIPLLEQVVADQRAIIADVTGRPASETPQVWALYKEVQDYYDHGMQVPDDVFLLFADDNWGQIRRLPTGDRDRAAGYGVYYHFDYVGAPRNYKWLNTVQIEKTSQQMDLAWQSGARSLWIVNVGDIKPMEFPISAFMRQAWDPEAMTLEALERYPRDWAAATFGPEHAADIADLVTRYSQYAARRKPELIDPATFPLGLMRPDTLDGGDFGRRVAEWEALEARAEAVRVQLPETHQAAYFQLVQHPIRALATLYDLYYSVAWNRRLAAVDDPRANAFADRAEAAFREDAAITAEYHAISDGKWDGMMLQTHIGYTSWQQPESQEMPEVIRVAATATPRVAAVSAPADAAASGDRITIEAPDFSRAVGGAGLTWRVIPNLGLTAGAVTAFPQGRPPTTEADGVRLEYDFTLAQGGDLEALLDLVPTLDTTGKARLAFGVSLDDGPMIPLVDSLIPAPNATTTQEQRDWNQAVITNVRTLSTTFRSVAPGRHTLKIWRLDDNVVLQRIALR
ncbi:hypothetical protein BZG35_06285 [Brevundimonas sp. LM2]|uniref:glycosyl hydrolase 115 family protein n=1 Tax=Brevundimonas sp. LM2 TaxID=1938605 RepID=UPI000983AA18|nr:glycosyl hydrolase 115 family protein [Brevundimonas sp. LM2]AQR61301.1 hypothetical protein BZG35_06285 [Brevundimonas sp. LM2]